MIVAAGADLREVTDAAVRACFSNSGQLCISIERIYVEESIAPEFIRMFGDRVKKMNLAAGYEFGIEIGQPRLRGAGQGNLRSCRRRSGQGRHRHCRWQGSAGHRTAVLRAHPAHRGSRRRRVLPRRDLRAARPRSTPSRTSKRPSLRPTTPSTALNASVWAGSKAAGEAIAARIHAGTVNVDEGYAPTWGSHRSTDGRYGCLGRRSSSRRRGADQVHRTADRCHHSRHESRWTRADIRPRCGQSSCLTPSRSCPGFRAGNGWKPPARTSRQRRYRCGRLSATSKVWVAFSPENTGGTWTSGTPGTVGAKFKGTNKQCLIRWSTHCTVVDVVDCRRFSFESDEPKARWTFVLEPSGTGTVLTETREIYATPALLRAHDVG